MQSPMLLSFLVVSVLWVPAASNPIGKVIQLLDDLAAKITNQGAAEEAAYKEYVKWCEDTAQNKGFEIKTATSTKEKLEAQIVKDGDAAGVADTKIGKLAEDIATNDADLKAATEVRDKELADFVAAEKELVDTIDTLGRAINIIGREMAKNPAAFAQIDASKEGLVAALTAVIDAAAFSAVDRQKLTALVQSQSADGSEEDDSGAPAAAVYKTHSGNILDVLQDLKDKAEEQLAALRKAESNAKHNYDMLRQGLEDQLAADNKDLNAEKAAKAAAEESEAQNQGELEVTKKDLADGIATLATVKGDCAQTKADHEASVAARNEELEVIAKAKQILADTTSGAVEQTYSFIQSKSKLQTRADLAGAEVITLVKRIAKEQHSTTLAQLAARIAVVMKYGASAGDDPFGKVTQLISDLIAKLESEADADATEKAYCDEQMAKTEEKKEDLEGTIAKLTTKIDKAASKSAGLKADVKELQGELAALAKEQAEMDNIRTEQHAAFVKAKAELTEGLDGVRRALRVLRDYYGNGASMLQQPEMPEFHGKATGAGQSIIGILEVAESDLAKNLAAEETQESDADADYQQVTQENKITRTTKEQDVKYKTQEFKQLDKSITELSSDRDTSSTELGAVLEYYGKIKERCIAKPETYAERKRRRQAEIAGLKQALEILENETAFMQRGMRQKFLAKQTHL